MGNRATASIGIVVAHRLHPLRDVLRQGREAEEDAKELYERNAICVRWLKRSGEQVQMGAQFFYHDHRINDTLQVLMEFAELMRTKIAHDGQKRNCQHWHRRRPSPSPAHGCASSRAGSGRGRQRTL
jgi:hypothetical protein